MLTRSTHAQNTQEGSPLASRKRQGLAIFTICSNNYLAMAQILIDSAKQFHPEATMYLCLVDRPLPDAGLYPDGCEVILVEDLPIPNVQSFLFRYDVMELNTAAKPFMIQTLLEAGHDAVVYFDPDIQIFSRLHRVVDALAGGASLVLTPHLCRPAEDPDFPDDLGIMVAGVFNLGFLAVRACAESDTVLAWWARRLEYQCLSEQSTGLFVDQKFMDLVPGFAERACILRDTAYNIGYWNLAQRTLGHADGQWTVDGKPLAFYHFSGFNPARMNRLSKHVKAFSGDAITPVLAELMQQYASRMKQNGHGRIPSGLYAFGRFASGARIPLVARKMFRERHTFWPGDPFESYEAYLQAPMPASGPGRPPRS